MKPEDFADQIAKTEQRYAQRDDQRAEIEEKVAIGGALAADTPERVALRMERLGVDPRAAEALVAERAAAAGADVIAGAAIEGLAVDEAELEEAVEAPVAPPEPAPPPPPAVVVGDRRSRVVLERLIGDNDLIEVAFLEAGYRAARSVGRIDVRRDGGHLGFGTGSLISPRLLLTNNHVLESAADAVDSRVEFDYQVDPDGVPLHAVSFALDPDAFFITDPELDYALVAVVERSGTRQLGEFGWNPLIAAEGKVLRGEKVNIVQHPGGEPKQLALRENKVVDLLERFIHYQTDTAPGSSGSPVYNDEWELIALHHSGVPKTDAQGRILALNGQVWAEPMGEGQIAWVANEGVRVSRIVKHLEGQDFAPGPRQLLQQVLEAAPAPLASAPAVEQRTGAGVAVDLDRGPDGAAVWTLPVQIAVSVGRPVAGARASVGPGAPVATGHAAADDAELVATLRDLERSRRRPYYEKRKDEDACKSYYAGINVDNLDERDLYRGLSRLVSETHLRQPAYKPSRMVYPWVDLHPDHQLRSIYSGKTFDPEEFIREDFAMEQRRAERLRELVLTERMSGTDRLLAEEAALEAAFPYNCEHVVPQSWFEKREPMRGDVHHLFACEWGCNSFRGNTPYYDFADFEEALRDDCGKREENRFEPSSGKGAAARSVLYFLLRYPKVVASNADEFERERLAILLDWHERDAVNEYEHHRNQAIFELQGNRNPLIDHPDWAAQIDFSLGLG
jgi:endonuclease G